MKHAINEQSNVLFDKIQLCQSRNLSISPLSNHRETYDKYLYTIHVVTTLLTNIILKSKYGKVKMKLRSDF